MDRGIAARSLIGTSGGTAGATCGKDQKLGHSGVGVGRKRLSDITNTVSSGRSAMASTMINQENPNAVPCPSPKDYIAQVIKENTALLKLVAERNKLIEASSIELQKLRIEFQKLNQQNWQLARVNSQMLAELNLGKDRLKALQHELGCAAAVIKHKASELEQKERLNKQLLEKIGCKDGGNVHVEIAADATHLDGEKQECKPTRKRKLRNQTVDSNLFIHPVASEEKATETRESLRRSSSNLKSEVCESVEDLLKVEDSKFQVHSLISEPLHEDASAQPDTNRGVESAMPIHHVVSDKVDRRRSLRLSDKLRTEACENVEDSHSMKDMKFPLCSHGESSYKGASVHSGSVRTVDSTMLTHEVAAERKFDGIRKSLRRRTGNLKPEICGPAEDLVKREEELPAHSLISKPLNEEASSESHSSVPSNSNSFVKQEQNEEHNLSDRSQLSKQDMGRRSLVGRPLRKAAEKVSSYKETSLRVKMRRLD